VPGHANRGEREEHGGSLVNEGLGALGG
jgi:hypothetical protein